MHETNTITKVMMAVLIAGVIAWAASISATVSSVTRLEPQIDQLQRTQNQLSDWVATWPTTGRLVADVEQTHDIEFLFLEMEQLIISIDGIEERIRDIELERAQEN